MNLELPNFKKVMRGYDPESVEQAWEELERHVSEANTANKDLRLQLNTLRDQNNELFERIREYEKIDADLRDALLSAQRIANQVKTDAENQSAAIIASARAEADELLIASRQEASLRQAELEDFFQTNELAKTHLELEITELSVRKHDLEQQVEIAYQGLVEIKEVLFGHAFSTD